MKKICMMTLTLVIYLTFISGCAGAIDHKVVANDASNNEFKEQYLEIQKERNEILTESTTIAVYRPVMYDKTLQKRIQMRFDYSNSTWTFYDMDYNSFNSDHSEIMMTHISIYYEPVYYPGELLKSLGQDEESIKNSYGKQKLYSYKGLEYYVKFSRHSKGDDYSFNDSYEITLLLDDKYKAYIEFYGGNEDELKDDIVHSLIDSFYFEKLPDLTIEPYDFSSTENSSDE